MKKTMITGWLLVMFLLIAIAVSAQDMPAKPKLIKTGTFLGISPPLRDIPPMSPADYKLYEEKAKRRAKNTPFPLPTFPYASTALPQGPDPVWQQEHGTKSTQNKAPILNFEGQGSPYFPPDCNGATGPNHFMQTVNTTYAIYNKSGTLVAGPTDMNLLFGSVTGASYNDGDPIILYDEQASRWLAVEFSVSGTNDYMLIAVSTTSDPTGTWYQYSFDVADMPDYEKMAVWQDGYYMGTNTSSGNDIYVFERSKMLLGQTAQMVAFDNPNRPATTSVMVVPPVDNDGVAAPTGSPGIFIAFNDDAIGGGSDQLWIWELAVNWTTPASSTFARTQQLNVASFDSQFSNGWENIDQPGTTRNLCAISYVIMNVPQYRNFGTYQTIVCCHTVDVDATDHAGVRWYELRRSTQTSGNWTIRQQGTYAPDAHSRWMGAIAMDGSNKIAIGYSISSATEYPGIRYTGQSSAAYAAATGTMDVPEGNIHTGANYQTTYNRWGDYSSLCVDPSDDQTFWYTTEYIGASEARKTKIATFRIGNAPIVATLAATSVTTTAGTLNGTVNPNGLATTYYFQYGTTTSYGTNTATTSAGSGSTTVSVNAALTGLTTGTTYHYRIVATNTDGTSYGEDLTFIPGGAVVLTTAASSITLSTAVSGGNVISDGGSAVTARGVCWSTSANPTIAGSHTTDGSGTGIFTSSITGLSSSTIYHVRAYATNANGTFYGEDLTFTTLCGTYNTLPFTESFSGTTIPTCWAQVDNQGNGQVWQFGTITGYTPLPALTGNYAYLNSDAYGSGNSQNADLVTPTLDLSGYTNVTLAFSHYFRSYTGSSGTISYSINNGSTWTVISTFTATSSTNPAAFSQVIAAVSGQSAVKFKWNYTGTYGYYWGIDNISITGTPSTPPTVTTTTATSIAATTATAGGNVTSQGGSSVTARGVCWGTSANPVVSGSHTTDGSGTGSFTSSITGLSPNTLYYYRAYATNSSGTSYGSELTFTTLVAVPTVTTTTPTSVTINSASSGGNVTSAGGGTVTARGVCWSTSANPTLANSYTTDGSGTGSFTSAITSLAGNTTYHVRAYATNSAGTAYGSDLSFTTLVTPPTVTTTTPSAVTVSSASSGGNVTAAGDATVTARGVCWSTGANPTTANSFTTDGTGTGAFTSSITGLSPNTTYHVRAYATNSGGTSYGTDLSFTTLVDYPVVTTTTATSILSTSASSGGEVTSAGGGTVTARGVCWSTASNPTLSDAHTTDGTGTGSFTSAITGLSPNTLYHYRAYATNSAGTSYGSDLTFTTTPSPTLSVTPSTQNVTAAAGSTSFTVTSNSSWTASSDQGWCTVTPSGTGNGTITANYTLNTVAARTANITVTVTGLAPIVVTVQQEGAPPALSVTPSNQNVTSAAGSTSFTVTANTAWTAASDQYWCTVTASGSGNGTLTANYLQNNVAAPRTATITVSATGVTPQTVTVTQAAGTAPEFILSIQNVAQTSASTLEFDIYLLDNNPATSFEMASVQCGILVNTAIYAGGTLTAAIASPVSSGLIPSQVPNTVTYTASQACIKLAGRVPPGAGNGSIISTVSPGTKVIRLLLTSTVPFASGSLANLTFTSSVAGGNPYLTRVAQYIGGTNTQLTVTPGYNAVVLENPVLNAPPTLSVTPSNQNMTTAAGSTSFTLSTNTSWTASSDQGWCTLGAASGWGNATLTANVTENTTSSSRVATITVTAGGSVTQQVTVTQAGISNTTVNLALLLEGLYDGAGTMHQAQGDGGPQWTSPVVDKFTVELHDGANYATLVHTVADISLNANGTATFTVPAALNGSYYLAIIHRNSLLTVTGTPISFASGPVNYNMTDMASRAYGGNMREMMDSYWTLFGGDVNQDGYIDTADFSDVDNDAAIFVTGYTVTDINGDGYTDTGDFSLLDNNAALFIMVMTP